MKIHKPRDKYEAADLVRRYAQDAILAAFNADRAADRQREAQGEFDLARQASAEFLTRSQAMLIWEAAFDEMGNNRKEQV